MVTHGRLLRIDTKFYPPDVKHLVEKFAMWGVALGCWDVDEPQGGCRVAKKQKEEEA